MADRRGEEVDGEATEVFSLSEHALGCPTVAIEECHEAVLPLAVRLGRYLRHYARGLVLAADRIAVVAFVDVKDRGYGIRSSNRAPAVQSATWSPVRINAIGRQKSSGRARISVIGPPRKPNEEPIRPHCCRFDAILVGRIDSPRGDFRT